MKLKTLNAINKWLFGTMTLGFMGLALAQNSFDWALPAALAIVAGGLIEWRLDHRIDRQQKYLSQRKEAERQAAFEAAGPQVETEPFADFDEAWQNSLGAEIAWRRMDNECGQAMRVAESLLQPLVGRYVRFYNVGLRNKSGERRQGEHSIMGCLDRACFYAVNILVTTPEGWEREVELNARSKIAEVVQLVPELDLLLRPDIDEAVQKAIVARAADDTAKEHLIKARQAYKDFCRQLRGSYLRLTDVEIFELTPDRYGSDERYKQIGQLDQVTGKLVTEIARDEQHCLLKLVTLEGTDEIVVSPTAHTRAERVCRITIPPAAIAQQLTAGT